MKEIEFLETKVSGQSFGVEIDAVRELSDALTTTPVPNSHPSVEGVYERRGETIAVINLRNCLGFTADYPIRGEFIVACVNGSVVALHVDGVASIHRVSEDKLLKPDSVSNSSATKGIVKIGDTLITVLDLENLVSEITGGLDGQH